MKLSNLVNTSGRQRFLAILITLLMAFSVAACGDDNDNSGSNNNAGADAGGTDNDAGQNGGDDAGQNGDDAGNNGGDDDTGNGTNDPELKCGEILACQGDCAEGDTTCAQACVSEGSTQGQLQFNAVSQCANTNCADATTQEAFSTCLNTNCSDEIAACDGLGGGGEGAEGAACVTDCTSNEDCSGGLTCEQYAQDGSKGCLMVQGSQIGIPSTATDCSEDATVCGADATCLPYGGGGDNGGGGQEGDGFCLVPCTAGGNECEGDTTCVDVNGQGRMQCVVQSNGGIAFPPGAPTCNASTPCPTGYSTDVCFIPG